MGEEGLARKEEGVVLMSLQEKGPAVLIPEMGSRPHLRDLIPRQGLYNLSPKMHFFFSFLEPIARGGVHEEAVLRGLMGSPGEALGRRGQ